MVARINISLPNELQDRIKQFKGSINVSAVCRHALEQRLEILEKARETREEDLDLNELVRRLRDERGVIKRDSATLGAKDARDWVRLALYNDIKKYGEVSADEGELRPPDEAMEVFKNRVSLSQVGGTGTIEAEAYWTAWLAYTRDCWQEVKVQVEEHDA